MDIKDEIMKIALGAIKIAPEFLGKLFPYFGLKKKAVDMYVKEIEDSDLSPETKAWLMLRMKENFKKWKNQAKIAEIAVENAKEGTDFSENSHVDDEWLGRFMDSAKFVSSEELQTIWGKILAGEFENPGSTPPNMVRVLSEFTPELAKAFRYICSMKVYFFALNANGDIDDTKKVIEKIIVPSLGSLNELGLTNNVFNDLESLGVLRVSDKIAGYISRFENEKELITDGEKIAVIYSRRVSYSNGIVMLTSAGETLRAITEPIKINDYFDWVYSEIKLFDVTIKITDDYKIVANGEKIEVRRKERIKRRNRNAD